jgi:hypothetical protein
MRGTGDVSSESSERAMSTTGYDNNMKTGIRILAYMAITFCQGTITSAEIVVTSVSRSVTTPSSGTVSSSFLGDFNFAVTAAQGTFTYTNATQSYRITTTAAQHSTIYPTGDSLTVSGSGFTHSYAAESGFENLGGGIARFECSVSFHLTESASFTLQATMTDSEVTTNPVTYSFCTLRQGGVDLAAFGFPSPIQLGVFPASPSGTNSGILAPGDYQLISQMSSTVQVEGPSGAAQHDASLSNLLLKITTLTGVVPSIRFRKIDPFNAELSWPTNAVGWNVESAMSLPATTWQVVANNPGIVGTNFIVTVGMTNAQQFFRLHKP